MTDDLVVLLGADLRARLIAHLCATAEREEGEAKKQFENAADFMLEIQIEGAQLLIRVLKDFILGMSGALAHKNPEGITALMHEVWDQTLPESILGIKQAAVKYLSEHFPPELAEEVVIRLMRAGAN